MKLGILLYIENVAEDGDLSFRGNFLPESLAGSLQGLQHDPVVYYSAPETYSGRLSQNRNLFRRKGEDDVEYWKDIFNKTGADHLCKINAGSAFLDASLIQEMIDLHLKYLAEFTFSENLPSGFSCEIAAKELIASLPDIQEKTLPLGQVIRSNINHFDIELYYKEPDIRDKRIAFLLGNKRDRRIMENIFALADTTPRYHEIKNIIETSPEVLYIGPSYLEIELTGASDLDCLYCYRNTLKREHGEMDITLLEKIISQMNTFDLPYTICFGGSGEPMMHAKFYEALTLAQNDARVDSVIVETNGLYADINYRNYLVTSGSKIKTIVHINGVDSDTYSKIHGKDCFARVRDNILGLRDAAADRLYIQIMKINETEPFLDAYYDFWEKEKVSIILQKQNTYLGMVQDRRYSDLTPIERVPCWHLQRDLYILSDGRVSFCKQDVDGEWSCGNLNTDTVLSIWEKKKESFVKDYKRDYATKPDCRSCDEWYTFNF